LGRAGLITPIWDVLAPQGEQERALNHLTTRPRSPAFQIRQVVPVGLLGLGFAAGLVGFGLSQIKICITVDIIHLHTFHSFLWLKRGGNGWMAADELG